MPTAASMPPRPSLLPLLLRILVPTLTLVAVAAGPPSGWADGTPLSPNPVWLLAWQQADGKVTHDLGAGATNDEFANCGRDNAIKYEVGGAPYAFYRRLQPIPSGFSAYEIMSECWKSKMAGGAGNTNKEDFWIMPTEAELLANDWHPAFRFCNFDDCPCAATPAIPATLP